MTRINIRNLFQNLLLVLVINCSVDAKDRPNVLFILTDDQGSIDLNCYGAKDLATPSLDDLAKNGIRFTQFYAGAPVCSSSRASLLTGRVPHRAGVPGNVSSKPGHAGMPSEQLTMAEAFQKSGYQTGHVGKWHLGYTKETMPNAQGFESSFGHMGGCIDNYSHFFYWSGPNRHDLWRNGKEVWADGEFFPDLMVRECKKFITDNQKTEKPFFLYWAINVPHYPLQGTEKWREHYKNLKSPRREYAEFVSTMDEKVGEVVQFLKNEGLLENTIIAYQSDHGHSTEERTFGGGGNSGPYRGAKFSLYEGGIRVPAIVSWKGRIPAGETRSQMVTACDWFPTFASYCGVNQDNLDLDGKSMEAVILSSKSATPHQNFHWQFHQQWVVRKGNWKLLANPRDTSRSAFRSKKDVLPKRYLVNLEVDAGEKNNLAVRHPEKVRELELIHQEWLKTFPKESK